MNKRKTICLALCLVIILLVLSGCSSIHPWIESRLKELNESFPSETKEKLEMSREILRCFNEDDMEGLKTMFCTKTQGLDDIDEQIESGFDIIDGNIVSFNEDNVAGSEGESISDGEAMRLDRLWSIKNITTNTSKSYEIWVNINLIYEDDKDREGITQLKIITDDSTEVIIGYKWPDYYKEGSHYARSVIEALSQGDTEALKDELCQQTLEIDHIDAQIQAGFDFFEGKCFFGDIGEADDPTVYDGKYDVHSTVIEDERVEDHVPVRTLLTVYSKNIMTDTGRIYEMELYAYLLFVGNEAYEGISQIKISSDEGRELIIGERLK